ncbi:hypothetical protein EXW72_05180 [Pseudomonas sp. BCA14]|uniref:hypothetical protein n=1 Tax=unclassified Pseudomonas TaxID=196821 RepID=UPI00106E3D4E|nr:MULTISPECIES: hypothetical protein [unclassified Pseudomonas]TFF14308.1 hypothetical protein EXW70_07305 [Pseudomonas sp. JMN1]TFF15008.1 hypothetical protein EXW71_01735 [Pseudomonas sp. BCA17]TFF31414.1 hypothetical protein EXW72_05180 [Pseudomonas sp. BCA14]TFF32368.1 hypothetical protein EXW73_00985 [Pseudomonas sp. BCA13]
MEVSVAYVLASTEIDSNCDKIIALPLGHLSEDGSTYHSSAPSMVKYLNKVGIKCDYLSEPSSLFEQRGAEWFGPTLLIVSSIYNSNPGIFSDLLEAIKNHITGLYTTDSKPLIKLNIRLHKDKESQSAEVIFEGNSEDFPKLLKTLEKTWHSK